MKLLHFPSPQDFLEANIEGLEAKEVVNSLMLGIVTNLTADPHLYGEEDPYLVLVTGKGGRQLVRASMTPPFGLILSFDEINAGKAYELIAADLIKRGIPVPDVNGPKPAAHQFAQVWARRTGGSYELEMAQRLYELREVTPVIGVPGEMVTAAKVDIPLIAEWMLAFQIDCFGEGDYSPERIQKGAARNVEKGAWHLWQVEGKKVSMVVSTWSTAHGIGVSGVYTPPELRGRGFASACVAAFSQKLLDQGYQFCSLFTDLTNPTSNSIYQQIGYRPVSDFDKYKLIPPAA